MSVVRIFTPVNRLALAIGGNCDPTTDSLIAQAAAQVDALKPGLRDYVTQMRATLAALASQSEELIFAECREIAAAALNICDIAGAAGLESTGEAARGIHAMIDALITKGVWHTDALKLHLDALSLLNSDPPPSEAAARKILSDLKAMRDWVGVPD